MKKTVLLISLVIMVSVCFSQNDKYKTAMKKNIELFSEAKSLDDFNKLVNQFDRITISEPDNWLPLYYLTRATVFQSRSEKDTGKKDLILDNAQKHLDKALELKGNLSELYVLQGFIHQSRIEVDPAGRGQKYSTMSHEAFEKAKSLNPENPRVYHQQALTVLNTPAFFGGGKENALPLFKLAEKKFEAFKIESELSPNWGNESNDNIINKIEQK